MEALNRIEQVVWLAYMLLAKRPPYSGGAVVREIAVREEARGADELVKQWRSRRKSQDSTSDSPC